MTLQFTKVEDGLPDDHKPIMMRVKRKKPNMIYTDQVFLIEGFYFADDRNTVLPSEPIWYDYAGRVIQMTKSKSPRSEVIEWAYLPTLTV